MGAPLNLIGQRFGRLVVMERTDDHITKGGSIQRQWICKCDCGNTTVTTTQNLRSGDTKSCGCLEIESKIKRNTTHGGSKTRLHKIWSAMRRRCRNKNDDDYKHYGGRGIKVCDEWNEKYETFRDWALCNGYSDSLTIDRIDVNGNYEPCNCRWIDMKHQANNKSNNRMYEYDGERHTISELSEIYGIKYTTLYMRLRSGLSIEDAINYNNSNN